MIYLDAASTMPLHPKAKEAIQRHLDDFGNPSSTHQLGNRSRALLEEARQTIASCLQLLPQQVLFTSGATEANNLVLFHAIHHLNIDRIISSRLEHLSVYSPISHWTGFKSEFIQLTPSGNIDLDHLSSLLKGRPEKTLVSLMHTNNEIGNELDLQSVKTICEKTGALWHSDLTQSIGLKDLSPLPMDFATASAHKFGGLKGCGLIFLPSPQKSLRPMTLGGHQEKGIRPGTEALINILSASEALKALYENGLQNLQHHYLSLKQTLIQELLNIFPETVFNGTSGQLESSSAKILSARFPKTKADKSSLQFQLDLQGIACSHGSACQSTTLKPSHVLTQILDPEQLKQPTLRFSFHPANCPEELVATAKALKPLINPE